MPTNDVNEVRLGIALSGGGSRAIAFHLGCLKCLHRLDLLQRAAVLSTVSGGSVIGAMYVMHEGSFEDFEQKVLGLLRRGLVVPALGIAFTTWEGPKALAAMFVVGGLSLLKKIATVSARLFGQRQLSQKIARSICPLRFASRTTILRRTMDQMLFRGARISDLSAPNKPKWIAIATELRTGSAFYFSNGAVGSWRYGRVDPTSISVAHAVTASAAFPLLLPALDEQITFESRSGSKTIQRVTLTDGGVYDNLGLAPLWPDRDPEVSLVVEDVNVIVACRAGDGLRQSEPSLFLVSRLKATFAAIHDRAQNATMKRLFDLKASGKLRAFLIPYLGQLDARLASPPTDLIPRKDVVNYPTNFSPMSDIWIERLSRRGDQLTLALVREHLPGLLQNATT